MNRFYATLASVTMIAVLGLCTSTQAATIANFRQNPANGGLSATGGVLSISNVPIDYAFQVPPGNTGISSASTVPGTYPSSLTISGNIVVSALGGGDYVATAVPLTFTIMASPSSGSLSNQVLLSGSLLATVLVSTNSNSITFQGTGSNWSSQALYDVGAGPATASALRGQTFSMSMLNLASITIGSGGELNFTSVNSAPGGSTITGNFAAVPEPASLVLMGLGLAGIPGVLVLRKRAVRA